MQLVKLRLILISDISDIWHGDYIISYPIYLCTYHFFVIKFWLMNAVITDDDIITITWWGVY